MVCCHCGLRYGVGKKPATGGGSVLGRKPRTPEIGVVKPTTLSGGGKGERGRGREPKRLRLERKVEGRQDYRARRIANDRSELVSIRLFSRLGEKIRGKKRKIKKKNECLVDGGLGV